MSFGVVRVQKMSKGSVGGIQIHDKREKNSKTNPDIDHERTKLNYNLAPELDMSYSRAVKKRIDSLNLPKAVRKDAVVMAQVLVTSDKDFFDELKYKDSMDSYNNTGSENNLISREKAFFQKSYEFLKDRYGEENIISATVHLDERTPHMHFNFVPVTDDGRLSAKSILTRQSLIEQQDAFKHEVGEHFGLKRGNRDGIKIHLETADFKIAKGMEQEAIYNAQKALQEVENIKADIQPLINTKNALDSEINVMSARIGIMNNDSDLERQKLEAEIQRIKAELEKLNELIQPKQELIKFLDEVSDIKAKKGLLGNVILNEKDFLTLKTSASEGLKLQSQNAHLKSEVERLTKDISEVRELTFGNISKDMKQAQELKDLKKIVKNLKLNVESMGNFILSEGLATKYKENVIDTQTKSVAKRPKVTFTEPQL